MNPNLEKQQRREAELRERDAALRAFYDSVPLMMGVVEIRGDEILVVHANISVSDYFGLTPKEEANWRSGTQASTDPTVRLWLEKYRQCQAEGQPIKFEYTVPTKNGADWFSATVSQLETCGSAYPQFSFVVETITARKQIENTLRDSETRYRAVVEDQTEVISRFTADGTLIYVNEVFCRFFGKTSDELVGHKWHPQVVADDLPLIEAKLNHLTPANPTVVIENRVYARNGKVHWMQFINRGFFDDSGRLIEMQSVGRDITDRILAEAALRENQALLRSFYDSAPFMMGVIELQGDKIIGLDANAKVASFFERTQKQMEKCDGLELNSNEFITKLWLEKYYQSQRERQAVHFEYQHPTKTGPVWISASVTPLSCSDCSSPRFCFVAEDATERKQSEEALNQLNSILEHRIAERTQALSQSEDLIKRQYAELELIYQTAPIGMAYLDRDFRYVRINERLAAINGKPVANHIGKTVAEIIPHIADEVLAYLRQVLNSGQPVLNLEIHSVSESEPGLAFYWLASYFPLKSQNGEVQGISIVVADVTASKRTEREKVVLARQRQLAFNAANLGWYQYNPLSNKTLWDDRFRDIFGLTGYEGPPDHFLKRIHPDDLHMVTSKVQSVLNSLDHTPLNFEHRLILPDGTLRWVHACGLVEFTGEGSTRYAVNFVGTVEDITEQKRIETELRKSREALETLTARLEEVREQERTRLGRELHDGLSQLLTSTKFKLALLRRKMERNLPVDAQEVGELEGDINHALEQAREMAHGLNPTDLVVRGLAAALQDLALNLEKAFQIKCNCEISSTMAIDDPNVALNLYRIAQEALQNTAQHSHARQVEVRLKENDRIGQLEILDDGTGFSPNRCMGGMGLPNMNARARAIGGQLQIKTVDGSGTHVICSWPIKPDINLSTH